MDIENRKVLTKLLVLLAFVALLASPAILKPGNSGVSNESSPLTMFGFLLEEVGEEVGIDFIHESPVLDEKIRHILPQIASVGASVSICDFDNDGWNDMYFTNSRLGTMNALYRNKKDGSFIDLGDSLGISDVNKDGSGVSMGSVWGDYDNDGFDDLFIYKWGKPELFKNIEGKEFERVTENSGLPEWLNANSAIWLDIDGDGLLDLFIGGYYDESLDLWNLNTTRIMPESYEYANNGGRNHLLKNQGDGTFKDVSVVYGLLSTKWTLAVGAVDVNGDNLPELIIANDYSTDEFYLNANGQKFLEIGKSVGIGFTPESGMNVSFGDVDNTGQFGFYITNITEVGVLLQGNNLWTLEVNEDGLSYRNSAGQKEVELGGWSYGAQFGDLNNDGFQDLYVANGFISADEGTSYWYDYSKVSGGNKAIISDAANWPAMKGKSQSGYQQNKIWVNDGAGSFEDVSLKVAETKTIDSRSVVFVDLWNRGVLDVVVANQNNVPLIYRNQVDSTNHWIDFELKGESSNRNAVGAKLELRWGNQKQVQVLTGGIGFSGQNQHRIHFGIGKSTQVDHLTIYWPSGVQQVIENPAIDQVHVIHEGKGIL